MKQKPNYLRLEQLLRTIEDKAFALGIVELMLHASDLTIPEELRRIAISSQESGYFAGVPKIDPLQSFTLRNMMLHSLDGARTNQLRSAGLPVEKPSISPHISRFHELVSWCQSSRRIYDLTNDLQLLLQNTALPDFIHRIETPFKTFCITLSEPIIDGDYQYDAILFSRDTDVPSAGAEEYLPTLTITLLPNSLEDYRGIDANFRRKLCKAVSSRDWSFLGRNLKTCMSDLYGKESRSFQLSQIPLEDIPGGDELEPITSETETVLHALERQSAPQSGSDLTPVIQGLRIALGFSLLLTMSGPHGITRVTSKKLPVQKNVPRAVTNEAQVCLVQTTHALSLDEKKIFREQNRRISTEVSPHFRSGYWSRPRGKGNDPTAEKTVWHPPVIVRKDRLPEGSLPMGTSLKTH